MSSLKFINKLRSRWKDFKYRFVPWIAYTIKDRKIRWIPPDGKDEILNPGECLFQLQSLLEKFNADDKNASAMNSVSAFKHQGFEICQSKSTIEGGGQGVFVVRGEIPKETIVAIYPGCVYHSYEPKFFQSIGNQFIFRCIDGMYIDGKGSGLSRSIYKSCSLRDKVGPHFTSDMTWFTDHPLNPISIGQIVNNQVSGKPSNVVYQELNIPTSFPIELRRFLPNVRYASSIENEFEGCKYWMKTVVLVSSRVIKKGEEILSNYLTIVS